MAFLGGAPKDPCCFAIDPACVRVVDPAWPSIRHTGDERRVSSRTWRKSMQVNQCVRLWILSRGFPCPDLPQQDALGESLDGARPSLLGEMLRIWAEDKEVPLIYRGLVFLGEEVASTADDQVVRIDKVIGFRAVGRDSGDTLQCGGEQLFWSSGELVTNQPDVRVAGRVDWDVVTLLTARPQCRGWLEQGSLIPGERGDQKLPTSARSTAPKRPPYMPAGFSTLQPHEMEAWTADVWREPAYQCRKWGTIQDESDARRLTLVCVVEPLPGWFSADTFRAGHSSWLGKEPTSQMELERKPK